MVRLRSSFIDGSELVLGEYAFTENELSYLKEVPEQEACRVLTDIGAAAVLIDNLSFTDRDVTVGGSETLPLRLDDGDVIEYPGRFVSFGIKAAMQSRMLEGTELGKVRQTMDEIGLTAHTI